MKCNKCGKEMSFENTTGRGFDIGLCEECEWDKPADLPGAEASAERISSVVRLLPCPFCGGWLINNVTESKGINLKDGELIND